MKLVKLICCISIFSLSYSNILSSSTFQLDTKDYSSIDSIVKYKQTYPKKALAFGFDLLKLFSEDDELTLEFVNLNYYIGETFYHLEDFVSSYEYLKKSLELYEFLEKNKSATSHMCAAVRTRCSINFKRLRHAQGGATSDRQGNVGWNPSGTESAGTIVISTFSEN